MSGRDEQRSKADLIAELQRLRNATRGAEDLVHDLEVHQEELRAQGAELLRTSGELEEERNRWAQLFDLMPIACVVTETSSRILEANSTAASLLGVDRRSLPGQMLSRYFKAGSRSAFYSHLTRSRVDGRRTVSELTSVTAHGTQIPVECTTVVQRANPRGDLLYTTLVDLRERHRAEADRARAHEEQQRMIREEQVVRAASEAKDRFLAMLSHELRTPLTPILFALGALRARAAVPEALEPTLDMIRRNVLFETRLIDDLLDMTRIAQARMSIVPEVTDVHELINDTVVIYREQLEQSKVLVTIDTAVSDHHVRADPVRLRQVIWNLLNNAVRNSPPNGRVLVRTANEAPGWVTITVQDNGRGIEPKVLANIFTFFGQDDETRRSGVGLGLGLAISKSIVESHGGRISAASEGAGRGATFTVELQTVPPTTGAADVAEPAVQRPTGSATILLVEDNEDSAAAMAEYLRLHGYAVKVARSVREALEVVDRDDILVSDIALPDGTGLDLIRVIAKRHPLRAIALSGFGSVEDAQRSRDAGFEYHIVKPVDPQRLLEALNDICAPPRSARFQVV